MSSENHETITATELARNVSMNIDKVRISGRSLYITKGSQTVAELCPPPKSRKPLLAFSAFPPSMAVKGFPVVKLADLFASLSALGDDAETMSKDIDTARKRANLPANPWD